MYQSPLENANTLEMKVISSLLIKRSFTLCLYIMEETKKEQYESNSGSAYETYEKSKKG